MEDIGGIIFYVIAAIIGIITTVGKKKKQKTKATSGFGKMIDEEVFDESFDQVREKPVYETVTEGEAINIFPETGRDIFSPVDEKVSESEELRFDGNLEGEYKESLEEEFNDEGISDIESRIKAQEEEEKKSEKDESNNKPDLLEDFDLKKAIVFSEILNRKYY